MAEQGMDSDETLFAAYGRGEGDKLGALVRRYEAPLFRFLHRRAGNAAQAEDLFQETWMNVIKGRASFREGRAFKPWLYAIALNLVRGSRRIRPVAAPILPEAAPLSPDTPTRTLARRETAAAVRLLIDALPEAQREVFLLSEYDGLTYAEIGELLARPLGTVKSQMHYALRQIRSGLERIGEEPA